MIHFINFEERVKGNNKNEEKDDDVSDVNHL